MKKKFYAERSRSAPITAVRVLLIAIAFALTHSLSAQNPSLKVFEDWRDTAGTQNAFYRAATVFIPGTTNSIVCGATLNSAGNYDMLVQKRNASGTVLWSDQYDGNGLGDDIATNVQVDPSTGYIFIVGSTYESSADSFNAIVTVYKPNGILHWRNTYNGTGSSVDGLTSLCIDASGNVYAGGTAWSSNGDYDFLAIAYDFGGSQLWTTEFDYSHMNDGAVRTFLSYNPWISAPALYLAGGAQTNATNYDYALINIDETNGSVAGHTYFSTTPMGIDRLAAIATDDSGNIYLTGSISNSPAWSDIRTMKLDTGLNVVWQDDYDGGFNLEDFGTGIALDSHNNVVVVGTSKTPTQGMNYTIRKYNNAGALQWSDAFNGSANGNDSTAAIVIGKNDTDAIYVTGFSYNGSTNDYYTMRYDGAGNRIWEIGMNSILNGDDKASAIAIDTSGNVIVTGSTKLADTVYAYTAVKYVQKKILDPQDTAVPYNYFLFLENRGQLVNTNGDPVPEVRYYNAFTSNPMVYFMDTAVSYVVARADTSLQPDSVWRVDVKFKGQNSGQIEAYNTAEPYMNFFYPHIPEGRARCEEYANLTFTELYNGVDVVYGSNTLGLKTFFITKPHGGGGSPMTQIDMKFEGADSVRVLAGGQLAVYTKMVTLIYPRPAVWQIDVSGTRTNLAWQPTYNIVGTNEVKFSSIGSYNSAKYLIFSMDFGNKIITPINPPYNNVWSTFVQGEGSCEFGHAVDVDANSNSYFTGTTTSYYFPALAGHQNVLSGAQNVFALKFDPQNHELWGTYIGGTYVDIGTDIKVDGSGNVFVYGFSLSSDYLPVASGGQYSQGNIFGDPTAIITKLDPTGQIPMWSTYIGGDDNDWWEFSGPRLAIDATNNVYIVGKTNSDASENFPIVAHTVSGTAYNQSTFGGGNTDGFIAEFDNNGAIMWSTFVGGNGDEDITSILIHPNSTIYIAGHTSSQTPELICDVPTSNGKFPICNSGGFVQGTHGGSVTGDHDAFIMSFDNAQELTWSTYYGGSGQEDKYVSLAYLLQGEVILTFGTESTTGTAGCTTPNVGEVAVCNGGGTYYTSNAGGSDIFMAAFDPATDDLVWGTFYGGTGDEYPWQASVAYDGFVVGGYTIGGGFPAMDPGQNFYKQTNNADGSGSTGDAIILGVSYHSVYWATHYGGFYSPVSACSNDEEWISGLAYDPVKNSVYAIGIARSMSQAQVPFPYKCGNPQYCWETTPQTTQQGYSQLEDVFLVEFNMYGNVGIADTITDPNSGISVYPNPSNGNTTVILPEGSNFTRYYLINSLGQVVLEAATPDDGHRIINLELWGYAEGVYTLQFVSPDETANARIVITK